MWQVDLVNELIKPISFIALIALAGLGWAMAIQLSEEVTDLRRRLGREPLNNNINSNKTGELMWEHLTNLLARLKAFFVNLGRLMIMFKSLSKIQWQILLERKLRKDLKLKALQISQSPFLKEALEADSRISHLGGSSFTVKEPELKLVRLINIWSDILGAFRLSGRRVNK